MPIAISPQNYWSLRARRYRDLIALSNNAPVDSLELASLREECHMGLFVQGMHPDLRASKVKKLAEYRAQKRKGENPTPPWAEAGHEIERF